MEKIYVIINRDACNAFLLLHHIIQHTRPMPGCDPLNSAVGGTQKVLIIYILE